MNKSLAIRRKLYLFLSLVFTFLISLYLFYFLINGERGIIAYIKINKLQVDYQNILSNLKKNNHFYNDRIDRLQPNTIDLDFLEEKLRQNTGLVQQDELLIFIEE